MFNYVLNVDGEYVIATKWYVDAVRLAEEYDNCDVIDAHTGEVLMTYISGSAVYSVELRG